MINWHPLRGWVEALRDWGWLIPTAGLVLAAFAFWAWNPANGIYDGYRDVAPAALGGEQALCPGGWSDRSARDADTVVRSCERDGWIVFLDIDSKFSHAYQQDVPGAEFVFSPEEVPGWPR